MVKNEIKVFARLKPETKRNNIMNYQIHRRPKKNVKEDYLVLNGVQKSINEYIDNRPESWNFAFYKIFDKDIKQDEIFKNVAQPVVQSVLNGYNATIFAYGQTGSGKTYSITGDPERYEDRGVLPRTIQYLFETIKKNPDNLYSVEIAYLEIYNENGYDLLDPKHEVVTKLEDLPRVTIQEDETGTLHLKNLSFRSVENENDALALLFLGDTNRAISETPMNPQSSRSHCIFTIAVSVKQSGTQHLTKAKMHLVDLAGSERVYKCCISGTILTEAKHINLSLHYLEQVIVCLGQQNVTHIPYRNSLLTAILRDSLGGNCLTTMLATLSLNVSNLEETISTCRFAQRVALIKNDVNLVLERNPEDENRFLKIEIEKLRNQIAQLTKRSTISGELTEEEKENLNLQVNGFLRSETTAVDLDNDERKVKYCLKIFREKFESLTAAKHCVLEPEKDLNYYRNLVVQRDKEISALIDMLKRTRKNLPTNSADDPGSVITVENQNETSPGLSIIAKKVRLRDVMLEAKSIAELIKNGKASIGDLRSRMTKSNSSEFKTLQETLQIEQSKLARNLSLLKTLKSEATGLKNASMIEENEYAKNIVTRESIPSSIEMNSRNLCIDDNKSRYKDVTSGQVSSSRKQEPEEQQQVRSLSEKEKNECTIVCDSSLINFDDHNAMMNENSEIISYLSDAKFTESENVNLRKPCSDPDLERNLFGRRFLDVETLHCGESRRPSFRAPSFLQEMLRSDGNFNDGFKTLTEKESADLTLCDVGINKSTKMEGNFRPADSSRSDATLPTTDVSESITNSARSTESQTFRVRNTCSDLSAPISDNFSPNFKLSYEQSDKTHEDSRALKKDSEQSDNQIEPLNLTENIESNDTEVNVIIKNDDDDFIKSLPLTGDPEIDEEIIAFYRAKRSGETY